MRSYVHLALTLRRPLAEIMEWPAQVLATAEEWLEAENDARKDAAKARG
jgi:hypothetical protein